MSQLQVGNKVTRVSRNPWRLPPEILLPPSLPEYGVVYTVRAVRVDDCGYVGILLEEIRNEPRCPGAHEQSFMAESFRRVVERKTDISIFQAMLTPKPVPVDALVP